MLDEDINTICRVCLKFGEIPIYDENKYGLKLMSIATTVHVNNLIPNLKQKK